ncbi:YhgE/Pip domain-containing protein [Streptomyces sp. NPDC003077]|uniref:YhgE/Pip domain-containing protein n=1 Tax=Streptomyces sp. NPDC003077 TaxID=3154443 RepID=UPI0033B71EFB
MRSPKLAALELKRFGRGKLPRLGLVALMLIPLLYGALYLCSFWDPYSKLDRIPVALVNEDKGAEVGGEKITVGDDLVKNLQDSKTFDWQEVDAKEAADGLEDGKYYLTLTAPADFSKRVTSSSGDNPETGALKVRTNDANSYIVGSISKTVFAEIRSKTSTKASRRFYDKIFVSFSNLHDQTKKAADGAGEIDNGVGKAKDGSEKLVDGLGKLDEGSGKVSKGAGDVSNGAGKLSEKAGELSKGAGDLSNGADKVNKGAGDVSNGASVAASKARQISEGTDKIAAGTQQLAEQVNDIGDKALPFLKKHSKEIGDQAKVVADGAQAFAAILGELPKDAGQVAQEARRSADELKSAYQQQCGDAAAANCPTLKKAVDAAETVADVAKKTNDIVAANTGDITALQGKLRDLQKDATLVAERAPTIASDADNAVRKINELNNGAQQISKGAAQFAQGIDTLAGGAGQVADGTGKVAGGVGKIADGAGKIAGGAGDLASGAGKVANGANEVHTGIGSAKEGVLNLDGGLYKLKDGTNQLATSLSGGVDKIPDLDKKDRDARTEVMANPVELASQSLHKAPNYGTGLAPYFIPLSLWVGAMVAFMLLQPLGKRALAAGAPGRRIALGGWLPAFAIGIVQVLALMAVLHWALGLEMERPALVIGFLILATACFTAIIQLLGAVFGPAGRVLTLVVLMLQLTSAGGTYPVETSPGFFSALHPFLPMSYVVDGLRRLITGGDLAIVWQGFAVLGAFTVGALVLTSLAARGRQVVRMKDLHPELSL